MIKVLVTSGAPESGTNKVCHIKCTSKKRWKSQKEGRERKGKILEE